MLPWDLEFFPDAGHEGLVLFCNFDDESDTLRASIMNPTGEPIAVQHLVLHVPRADSLAGGSIWLHGRYMQRDALVRNFGAAEEADYSGDYVATADDGRTYSSSEVAVLTLPSLQPPSLLLGCIQPGRQFVDVRYTVNAQETHGSRLEVVFDFEGVNIAPGETVELPALFVRAGQSPVALIEEYAGRTATEMNARVPEALPTGWCSWYYYNNQVTEADVVANLEALAAAGLPADVVQVDDGFQAHTGDWLTPNERFPSGMKALAERITAAGRTPGLWLAPFVFHEDSAILKSNREMMLHRQGGELYLTDTWLGRCAVLDCTHPAGERWLRETVTTIVGGWGYRYLKLDALAFAAVPARDVRYHGEGTTAPANLRRGLEIIREAAGDAFLLGCTAHFGPSIGLVDAMRVGPDVSTAWFDGTRPSVRHAMRMTLQRNWMHGRWWANDPDCLLVRTGQSDLSDAETRFLATSIALSGGSVFLGDDVTQLPPARSAMAAALLPPVNVAAAPVDFENGPVASAWRTDLGDGRSLLGVINWSDEPRWVTQGDILGPGETAFDFWRGHLAGMGDVLLEPHGGLLLQVTASSRHARIVGDSGHVNYAGLFQREVSARVQVRNDGPAPRTIAVRNRRGAIEVELAPGESRWFD